MAFYGDMQAAGTASLSRKALLHLQGLLCGSELFERKSAAPHPAGVAALLGPFELILKAADFHGDRQSVA